MVDYSGNRHNERYTYTRVGWDNWAEHENYPYITEGTLEYSASSDLKVTGSFTFEGNELPNTNDLLRVYYDFDDDNGEHAHIALATLFTAYADLEHADTVRGIKSKGTLDGSSMLRALEQKIYGAPYTITANTNAIYKAVTLIKSLGLNVDYTPDITVLASDHTFDAGASYLEMVNWLCSTAGYSPATPDAYGTIQLQPYTDTLNQAPAAVFTNDDNSIMYPEISVANDWANTPNVVKLFYNTDQACIIAEARNESGSRASLDARGGREQTYYEDTSELPDNANKLTSLLDLAESKLRELSCDIEYVTISHAYIPLKIYDLVQVNYATMSWSGTLDNLNITLAPSTKCQSKIKRELYDNIHVTKSGEVLR